MQTYRQRQRKSYVHTYSVATCEGSCSDCATLLEQCLHRNQVIKYAIGCANVDESARLSVGKPREKEVWDTFRIFRDEFILSTNIKTCEPNWDLCLAEQYSGVPGSSKYCCLVRVALHHETRGASRT